MENVKEATILTESFEGEAFLIPHSYARDYVRCRREPRVVFCFLHSYYYYYGTDIRWLQILLWAIRLVYCLSWVLYWIKAFHNGFYL